MTIKNKATTPERLAKSGGMRYRFKSCYNATVKRGEVHVGSGRCFDHVTASLVWTMNANVLLKRRRKKIVELYSVTSNSRVTFGKLK